ncbi:hypothetical protein A5N78_00125 [Prescottella equi]|jgi:hypothetical protein|uniref:DUF4383 domain-containing protein n=1 Tax=Rhodococcus hoagii TaxID=43767 RepID=A0AAE4ZFW8_RHOHA|nr:DUF4383 domain-containing protein [Prescottella equi]MBU4613886.1 DUF4383 domain-containing protein [Rhodococcus sp. GG48]GBF13674.1 hypothetical protein Br6_01033 [Rhodococcus sp. Br-6]MBM4476488.1 DUF4383 domain-containing protein [Prescottella equi]MBM4631264.1 DUF4383 domain-containing protein [Prescottella equi]MBM4693666.1 DUF4383 domain-containing protein [Prescottella equi]
MSSDTRPTSARKRSATEVVALVFGVVFLVVGIAGFIPGITTDYDTMTWAGHHSDAKLLGIFEVSVLHNIIHLAFGVAGIVMARSMQMARTYLIAGGVVYFAVWIYGVSINRDDAANFIPVNDADNWLHLGLAVAMIVIGGFLPPMETRNAQPASRRMD